MRHEDETLLDLAAHHRAAKAHPDSLGRRQVTVNASLCTTPSPVWRTCAAKAKRVQPLRSGGHRLNVRAEPRTRSDASGHFYSSEFPIFITCTRVVN
jgi:hypothetical protein